MGAIGLNPIRLDRIGLDPIRINAIKLGVPGASSGSERPYIDPEVLASLKAVCICYGKSNDDPDRAVVKNLVDPDNPFVISNAAFKLNSGFGEYSFDFERWGLTKPPTTCIRKNDSFNITYVGNPVNEWLSIVESSNTSDSSIDLSFKVEITGLEDDMEAAFVTADMQRVLLTNGINVVNITIKSKKWYGFNFIRNDGTALGNCNIVVRQIPGFQGAFVTDGIDDLITSTKTVQEMGITDEVTIVSMIHQIDLNSTYTIATTNYIENSNSREHVRSDVYNYGKTGIYGYSASLINNTKSDINNILGDEADYYVKSTNSLQTIFDAKFSVVGRISELTEASQVAWYWTIIANKVLTTDQINQVIAYFNLDRTLNPDILCNTIKQGITNENHAEFGDKLIDYSGNGRDIQLNNIAWNKDSGIGKYGMDFLEWKSNSGMNFTSTKLTSTKPNLSGGWLTFRNVSGLISETKVKVSGAPREFGFIGNNNGTDDKFSVTINNGVYTIPKFTLSSASGFYINNNSGDWSNLVIEQIPSHAGALCLDGVNDFGKVTGMPIYKDYTIVVDYERISGIEQAWAEALISKSYIANQGAFVLMETNGMAKHSYSFGAYTTFNKDDSTRTLLYQSKYKCGDVDLNAGTGIDGDTLWLGTYRDNYSSFFNGAIYSLMSFPYSMSEFLIERQLKKHKLGTLYLDMVEFRPIVKSNSEYQVVDYYIDTLPAVVGNYYPINSKLRIAVTTKGEADEVTSLTINGTSLGTPSVNGNRFTFNGTLSDKSPQKINITIYQPPEYLTMLSNSTLISNETLIKNE